MLGWANSGKLGKTVSEGTCASFTPFLTTLVAIARISDVELNCSDVTVVFRFMKDFKGVGFASEMQELSYTLTMPE